MIRTCRASQLLRSSLLALVFLALLFAAMPTPVAHAATITVNTNLATKASGDGLCSLPEAIENANTDSAKWPNCAAGAGTDIINLSPAGMIITLSVADNNEGTVEATGLPIIQSDITINGNGATIQRSSAGGTPRFRILKIMGYRDVRLNDLTITNGSSPDGVGVKGGEGGGIQNNSGTLTLSNVTLSQNRSGDGTFGGNGGAIMNAGTLTVTANSLISSNVTGAGTSGSAGLGGGVFNSGTLVVQGSAITNNETGYGVSNGGNGGGIYNYGTSTVTITDGTISGNITGNGTGSGGYGGGIYDDLNVTATIVGSAITGNRTGNGTSSVGGHGGGIYHTTGTMTISASSITGNVTGNGNSSVGQGGRGGGIYSGGPLVIVNSTVAGNTTGTPGSDGGGILSEDTLDVTSSTIANNTAVWNGGGIKVNVGTGIVTNTIVANNSPATYSCLGVTNGGNNLDSGTTCGWGSTNGSMSNTDPLLGALANNGGPTKTLALLMDSPAIDGVTYNPPNGSLSTDQRGAARPSGPRHDIGAYEANFITVTDASGGTGAPGCKLRDAITSANTDTATGGCSAGFGPDIVILPNSATITLSVVDNGSMLDTNGLPFVTTAVSVRGNNSIIERSATGSPPAFRILSIGATGNLTLNNVTIRNGKTADGPPGAPGGAGGGILNAGTLTVNNSTISGNHTGSGSSNAGGAGGGINSACIGTLSITNSTISGNTTGNGTGGGLGAGVYVGAECLLYMTNTTIAGNTTGSPNAMGGGLVTGSYTATVTSSTIANNSASGSGGGIRTGGVLTTLRNTIVANNTAPISGNCDNTIINGGNNLESADSCNWASANGSMSNTDPLLAPLAKYGGPTQTMALRYVSPAIDGVTFNAPNSSPVTDQRGSVRPFGSGYDIGAFEGIQYFSHLPAIKRNTQ